MSRRAVLLVAALGIGGAFLMMPRESVPPLPLAASRGSHTPQAQAPRVEPAVDPEKIRDVFRFVEPAAAPSRVEQAPAGALAAPSPSPGPFRLVGLVRREGRLLAAFAAEGDVVLAGPGQAAFGLTVLEVGAEAVRVRLADGSEARLVLP